MRGNSTVDRIAKSFFDLSVVIILAGTFYIYGVLSHRDDLFPLPLWREAYSNVHELLFPSDKILKAEHVFYTKPVETLQPDRVAPGLLMIVGSINGTRDTYVRVIDRNGTIIHEWTPRWTAIWGNVEGKFPTDRRPRGNNGMYLHGIDILPDASVVANFEHLSTFRMNICGDVEWKLDNLGHHSVFYSNQGYLWVTAERYVAKGKTGYQNHRAPLRSWKVQKISLDGKILKEIEMIDLLRKNDLYGLLYLSTTNNTSTAVSGDTLHLNDVEEFPVGMESKIFKPGDLLVSLRNINAVLVFDPNTLKIKFLSIGRTLRQHDADFLPDDRISVFDNRNLEPSAGPESLSSRIVEINARDGSDKVVLQGEGDKHFFSAIMGTHQHLANGNILVNSSGEGRVIEFAPDGTIVWRYEDRLSDNMNGRIYMAKLLPETMDAAFFRERYSSCGK